MALNFQNIRNKVAKAIPEIIRYHDCIAWSDLSDRGNPCYDPYDFPTIEDREEEALTYAAVKIELPKNSASHLLLSALVADDLGAKWITYDWLIKAITRVTCGATLEDLRKMLALSSLVKAGMKRNGTG